MSFVFLTSGLGEFETGVLVDTNPIPLAASPPRLLTPRYQNRQLRRPRVRLNNSGFPGENELLRPCRDAHKVYAVEKEAPPSRIVVCCLKIGNLRTATKFSTTTSLLSGKGLERRCRFRREKEG